jgi:peroxiredoxin
MGLKKARRSVIGLTGALGVAATIAFLTAAVLAQGRAAPLGQEDPGQGRGGRGIQAPLYPTLPIGSDFPEFNLLGLDGKHHTVKDYGAPKILAVMFESNHCPASIAYEGRVRAIYDKYRSKGVQVIAINPNNPKAVRLNELGYTEMSDSLEEMKERVAFAGLTWPYLYDGETQTLSQKFGAVATPHMFIFDQHRKLRYQGAIDDNRNINNVKVKFVENAIDALLAGGPVPVAETRAPGCSTKWIEASVKGVEDEMKAIQATPVTLTTIDTAGLKALRANAASNNTIVVSFWRTGNAVAEQQFVDLQNTYRMYHGSPRPMDLITVSTDPASRTAAVLDYLKSQYATTTNRQLSVDVPAAQAAFGLKWNASQPFTVVIGPDGKLVYQKEGRLDIHALRRYVLATIPENPGWPGVHEYYAEAVAKMEKKKS